MAVFTTIQVHNLSNKNNEYELIHIEHTALLKLSYRLLKHCINFWGLNFLPRQLHITDILHYLHYYELNELLA